MTSTIRPAPVRHAVTVKTSQARAFETFTAGFGRWWRRTGHGIGGSPMKSAIVEPFAGGRWYEIGEDDVETDWGKVLAWEPNERLLLAWQIGADWRFHPELITEVEVRFTALAADVTRVELEHRNLERIGEEAGSFRDLIDSPKGWADKLEKFAAAASEAS
jgi:uncharacterized protein YndB with AHSA1/START domain